MTPHIQSASTLSLGGFLRDRRARLAPAPDAPSRRRTPGLRREEVASRASVSVTWYTWLEQGRGGPPSDEVLERLAQALELDGASRELLFLLAQQRPPPLKPSPAPVVPASLQRVLDAMPTSPAYVKTPIWDIVAWNEAANAVLTNYELLPPADRNVLRRLFVPGVRKQLPHWESDARFAIASFRVDLARIGGSAAGDALAAELHAQSADFRRLWAENEVRTHGVGVKHLERPGVGRFALEYSAFAVDGSEGLSMVIYTPQSPADRTAVEQLIAARTASA